MAKFSIFIKKENDDSRSWYRRGENGLSSKDLSSAKGGNNLKESSSHRSWWEIGKE